MGNLYQFKQGRTFSFLVTLVPDELLPPGYFEKWSVKAEVRRFENRTPNGFLTELDVYPVDPENNLYLIYHEDTSKWPVGKIELDFFFTHPHNGYKIPTKISVFENDRVVTRT